MSLIASEKPPRRVAVHWPDGRVTAMPWQEAVEHIKAGDANSIGEFSIRMKNPRMRGLRGPSCKVDGHANGRAVDGYLKQSYLERIALKSGAELAELELISRRIRRSVFTICQSARPEFAPAVTG